MSDLLSPLSDLSTFETQLTRPQVKFSVLFKENLKLQFKLRKRRRAYYILYLSSLLLVSMFIMISMMPTFENDSIVNPEPRSYTNSLIFTQALFSTNSSHLYIVSKNNESATYISRSLFKAKNYEILSNRKEISEKVGVENVNFSDLFGLDFESDPYFTPETKKINSMSVTTISPYISSYSPMTFIISLYEFVMNQFCKNVRISTYAREYARPSGQLMDQTQSISVIYFILGHALIVVASISLYYLLNSNKCLFLLEINGITNKVRFYSNLVILIIEHLPISIIATSLFCFVGNMSKGTNFLLFFVSDFLFSLSLISVQIFFQPLLHSKGSSSAFCSIFILFLLIFQYLIMFQQYVPEIAFKTLLCLFSPASFVSLSSIMIHCKSDIGSMNWSNLFYSYNHVSGRFALLAQFLQCLVYFLFAILGNFCNSNCYGKPPIGWKNLFKLGAWKRMTRKSSRKPLLNRRMENYQQSSLELSANNEREFDTSKSVLEFSNLCKTYKTRKLETKALDNVSLQIAQGEFIVALGSNGSGKTTLISSISGAIDVDQGSILFYGEELKNDFDGILYPELGIVFQDNVLFEGLSVKEHFELFGSICGFYQNQILSDMNNMLNVLKMSDMKDTLSDNLSGGNKRKLCVALSLLKKPSVIIMDEPTAGVDIQSRQLIWKVINEFSGATVFTTSHSVEECESISTRLLLMSRGQVAFVGTAAELREKYNCCYFVTIIDNNNIDMQKVLDCANELPQAQNKVRISTDHTKTLLIPNNLSFADILGHIDENKEALGIINYTVHVENLEDTMRKIIQDDEALLQN